MISPYTFYNRYIAGLNPGDALDQRFPLWGESPFGEGQIEIDKEGRFNCTTSGESGDATTFLQKLYPLLTKEGATEIIEIESEGIDELEVHTVDSKINSFRTEEPVLSHLSTLSGVSEEMLKLFPIWSEQDGLTLNTAQYSRAKKPICLFNWQLGERFETLTGIPRISPATSANRVWFVENPLEAHVLQQVINEPVYIRPNQDILLWNNYQELTREKQIVLLRHPERGDWEYSFFPFLRKLNQWNHTCQSLSIEPMTKGMPFLSWIQTEENKQALLKQVDATEAGLPILYDDQTYHDFIGRDGIRSMYSPQDVQNGKFWYKLKEGSFVHSSPINLCSGEQLQSDHKIDADDSPNDQLRLSKDQVFNISVSATQLTPSDTFTHLRQFILENIYLEHKETATLISLWIMGGYVYRLFPAYAYLHLKGEKETGKTTLLEIITLTGFNGLLESQSTRASITDQVHKLGSTLCLDEFESSSLGTGDAYTQMLKGGYKKGGSYSKKNGNTSQRLNTYSPKVLASIDSIGDSALQTRTIPIKTVNNRGAKILNQWNQDGDEEQQQARIIRQGCYALGLFHHSYIQKLYHKVPPVIDLPSGGTLSGRKHQLVAPLLALAQLIDINGVPQIETELLEAVEMAWDLDQAEQKTYEKLLSEILSQWDQDSSFEAYRRKDQMTWIDNSCWNDTSLARRLDGHGNLLGWMGQLPGVKKESRHLSSTIGTRSCSGFPDNLKINGKPFRDWFSR